MERAVPFTLLIAASTESAFQVRHLLLGDFQDLLLGDLCPLLSLLGRARSLRHARGALQQKSRGPRRLGDEGKRAVVYTETTTGMIRPSKLLGAGPRIELLAEFHDVDLRLTERRTNRGSRRSLARRYLQLHRNR